MACKKKMCLRPWQKTETQVFTRNPLGRAQLRFSVKPGLRHFRRLPKDETFLQNCAGISPGSRKSEAPHWLSPLFQKSEVGSLPGSGLPVGCKLPDRRRWWVSICSRHESDGFEICNPRQVYVLKMALATNLSCAQPRGLVVAGFVQ